MNNSNQPRKPAGTPAGGQWAPTAHAEPEIELAAALSGDYQGFLEREEARCGSCDGYGWVRDVPEGGYRSLAPEVPCRSCRGTGHVPTAKDWAKVGITDPEALAALRDGEYRPEDLGSRDPNLRIGAHIAAGSKILDGELLSNALVLRNHNPEIDSRRCYQQRSQIIVGAKKVRWLSLSAEEQCEHIAGYAAGVAGSEVPAGASELFRAGHHQGALTEQTARLIDEGVVSAVAVIDMTGRQTMASDIEPLDVRNGYYTGYLAPSPNVPYEQKAMIARDAIVGPVANTQAA
jgi:hypothetical protein